MRKPSKHLPMTLQEAQSRGWDELDIILVTGDAHVDHPAFPSAILGRLLESEGFRVGVISRPDPKNADAFAVLGTPRLFFGVTSGSLDSMVGNYTANKRRRSDDPFAPGGKAGGRPDRAINAYCNNIRQKFGKSVFIVAGGLEASLRRFAHYDYWSDSIRRPVLMDCGADILIHGMGEGPIVDIAHRLDKYLKENPSALEARKARRPVDSKAQVALLSKVPGVVYREAKSKAAPEDGIELPAFEEVVENKKTHAAAHMLQSKNRDSLIWQECVGMRVIANPPWPPLNQKEIDRIYALPYTRNSHPSYHNQEIPALKQVRFGVTTHRGCFGGCSFCAIGAHQGKTISSRSKESILEEIKQITRHPEFKGTISDVGGPTSNMYMLGCSKEKRCDRPSCLWPRPCKNLKLDQSHFLNLLKQARNTPGVKHLFVTTGIRTDIAVKSESLIKQLAKEHTSGLMKVAPEHVCPNVLEKMRKPAVGSFIKFLKLHRRFSQEYGKEQYVLPYLMAAHPGCRQKDMEELQEFLKTNGLKVEQCQIFTPTPGTASTVMYATGLDPATLKPVFVERNSKLKEAQKQMILHHLHQGKINLRKKRQPKKSKQFSKPYQSRRKKY